MVVSASVWLAVTSAPSVTFDRPIRPLIGAGTRVKRMIDLRCAQRRVVLRNGGIGLPRLGDGVGIILLGDRLHLGQRRVARGPRSRGHGTGAGALQVGRGLRRLRR